MSTDSPRREWARDIGITLLVVCVLILVLSGVFLFFVARDWADARTPWFGRAILTMVVTVTCVRIVRELVTPARSRTRSDVVAAGIVVALAGTVLYFAVVQPALRDRERDAAFTTRISEQKAQADAMAAIVHELPDPATASTAEIRVALARALAQMAQVQDVDPAGMTIEEFSRYTPKQRGELLAELARTTTAMKEFRERHSALKAVLDKKKDKP
jgi:hypothetical protein